MTIRPLTHYRGTEPEEGALDQMDDLIEALTILRKYGNPKYPTHCEHDELVVCGIKPSAVSAEDKGRLDELGFIVSTDEDDEDAYFLSFRFGSA